MFTNGTRLWRHGDSTIALGNRNVTTACPRHPGHCESTHQRCSLATGCGIIFTIRFPSPPHMAYIWRRMKKRSEIVLSHGVTDYIYCNGWITPIHHEIVSKTYKCNMHYYKETAHVNPCLFIFHVVMCNELPIFSAIEIVRGMEP